MRFHDPWVLALIACILLLFWRKDRRARLTFSYAGLLPVMRPTLRVRIVALLPLVRAAALVCMVVALARPQAPLSEPRRTKEGVDMVLLLDASTSMEALDFKLHNQRYNRLQVVKQVVEDFIGRRENDRVGMIAFAGRPYVVCPLTIDRSWLLQNLERVRIGMVEDGTAIGSAILAGLNRLRQSTAKSKVMILLTDGRNNAGKVSPLTAAEAAAALGIKIYTIGAGSTGPVPYPVRDVFGNTGYQSIEIDLDEDSLRKIAERTNGQYFRATDTASLQKVYTLIDKLERTPFHQPGARRYAEKFSGLLFGALALIFIEVVAANIVAIGIP